jgi:hypothetical protein
MDIIQCRCWSFYQRCRTRLILPDSPAIPAPFRSSDGTLDKPADQGTLDFDGIAAIGQLTSGAHHVLEKRAVVATPALHSNSQVRGLFPFSALAAEVVRIFFATSPEGSPHCTDTHNRLLDGAPMPLPYSGFHAKQNSEFYD